MNGFIGTLAAQLALQPVSPAADGIASRPRNAFPSAWRWRYVDVMRSQVSDDGNILPRCIPKKASDGKKAPSWQFIAAVHPKQAGFGKICAPCIRNAPQIAVGGYTARRSCQEGALFAARTPRIMHGAQILPRFSFRKALRTEGKRSWVSQVRFALRPTASSP